MNLLISYGTRPEWLKIKPLIKELARHNVKFKTLFTGQHKDIVNTKADFNLEISNFSKNRLNNITSSILNYGDDIFEDITHIIVHGDTTSAMSIAVNAFHRKIKIIHLEAGLRTYDLDNPYPEEFNRQIISKIADINLCPTENNFKNLKKEGVAGKCYIVGNTALDNLLIYKNQCEYQDKVLITLHRRENHATIAEWFTEINKLADTYKNIEFILPLHPNPSVQKHKKLLNSVSVTDPLQHEDMIKILTKTKLVITDSGGLQEESSFFNKKSIICRKISERAECEGIHSFLCDNPSKLLFLFDRLIYNYYINCKSPFGDGESSKKIIKILLSL